MGDLALYNNDSNDKEPGESNEEHLKRLKLARDYKSGVLKLSKNQTKLFKAICKGREVKVRGSLRILGEVIEQCLQHGGVDVEKEIETYWY